MKKNLRSEAAIKRVLAISRLGHDENFDIYFITPTVLRIRLCNGKTFNYEPIAELDLREFVKKRQPLKGIKKQVDKIVRGSKVKPKREK